MTAQGRDDLGPEHAAARAAALGHYQVHWAITGAVTEALGELLPYLDRRGLAFLHGRLDPEVPSELLPGDRRVIALRLRLNELLAADYGVDLDDVPGVELPDDPDAA